MRRKKLFKNFFGESLNKNMRSYYYYFNRLKELAISSFIYDDMPDTMDSRFLEETLFNNGCALLFRDDVIGDINTQVTLNGNFNIYNIPKRRHAYASNGYNNDLDESNSVVIYNNLMHSPAIEDIQYFARRLWRFDSIIDINANAQKTPLVMIADEKNKLTVANLFKEYDGNAPVIFGDKNLNISEALTTLNTAAPYVADKILQLKKDTWQEALTYLGISNLNINKKERLISDEVNSSQGGTLASRNSRLQARQQALTQYNNMFNTDIKVRFNDFYNDGADATKEPTMEGGETLNE